MTISIILKYDNNNSGKLRNFILYYINLINLCKFFGAVCEIPDIVHYVVGWEPHGVGFEDTDAVEIDDHLHNMLCKSFITYLTHNPGYITRSISLLILPRSDDL